MANLSVPLAAAPRRVADLPSPKGLPWIGNALQIEPLRFHLQLERWAAQLGTPYRVQLGREPLVVWNDVELFHQVLRERPHAFSRGEVIGKVFGEMGILGLFAAEGPAWAPQRRMVMQALNATHFRAFFPKMQEITQRLYRRWVRAADRGETLDMTHELMRYTVDVTSALAFGADPNTLEQDGDRIQQHLGYIFPMAMKRLLAPLPYWRWFKLPQDRRLDRALAAVHAYVRDLIARSRERMRAEPAQAPRNLLEAMLVERDRPGSDLDDDTVAANVLTLLLAGEDTTANSLAWTMPFLAADAALQQRLHEAAVEAFADSAVCKTHEDLRSLDLFEAVVNEAQRLHPVAGLNTFSPLEDCVVGGVELPRGIRNFGLHRPAMLDARYFADPERFEPERWLRGHERECAHEPRAFLQFGAGPRVCPGRHLAAVEMRLVLSMLMRHFRVELTVDASSIEEVSAFAVTPSCMPVRLHHRAH
jgi:cytochrome P450